MGLKLEIYDPLRGESSVRVPDYTQIRSSYGTFVNVDHGHCAGLIEYPYLRVRPELPSRRVEYDASEFPILDRKWIF